MLFNPCFWLDGSDLNTLSWGIGGNLFPIEIWTQNCCNNFQKKKKKKRKKDLKLDGEACYGAGLQDTIQTTLIKCPRTSWILKNVR